MQRNKESYAVGTKTNKEVKDELEEWVGHVRRMQALEEGFQFEDGIPEKAENISMTDGEEAARIRFR